MSALATHPSRFGPQVLLASLGLLFLVAALFSGGADPGPRLVLQWLSLLLIGLSLWEPEPLRLRASEILMLGGLFILPLLYLIPLPATILAMAPGREVFAQTLALVAPEALMEPRALSLHPLATESAWLTSLIALGVYLATRAISERQAEQLTYLLFAVALVQVVIGLIQFASATTGVSYELAELAPRGGAASGTYRNRNHLAGLLEMVFPLALALFLFHFGRKPPGRRHGRDWRHKLVRLLRAGGRPSLAFALLAVIFVVGIVVTRSRSGIAMAMLGLILVAIVFSRHLGGGGSFGLMGRLTILVIGFTLALGLAPVLDRFAWGDMEGDARWRVAGATLDGAGTLLPLGSGPGTYPEVFPVHQPIELGQWFINHAHNDYLEVLYETGVPGWVLLGLFVALFLRQGVRLLGGAEWSRFRCLQVGAGIGLFLLLGHGFTDYNLRVPVNLAIFAYLAGLYFSPPARLPVGHRGPRRRPRTRLMDEHPPGGGGAGGGAALGGEAALGGKAVVGGGSGNGGRDEVTPAGGRGGGGHDATLASAGAGADTGGGVAGISGGARTPVRRPRNPFDVPEPGGAPGRESGAEPVVGAGGEPGATSRTKSGADDR